jgi:mersacidin/lichenicidin family type 2 lantibiotic
MLSEDVIRAWKDREYRQDLSQAQQDALPVHPAGVIELTGDDLHAVGGTYMTTTLWTITYELTTSPLYTVPAGSCGACGPLHPDP